MRGLSIINALVQWAIGSFQRTMVEKSWRVMPLRGSWIMGLDLYQTMMEIRNSERPEGNSRLKAETAKMIADVILKPAKAELRVVTANDAASY